MDILDLFETETAHFVHKKYERFLRGGYNNKHTETDFAIIAKTAISVSLTLHFAGTSS